MEFMVLTRATFQSERSELKAAAAALDKSALANIWSTVLTLATFHFEMSALNVDLPPNSRAMFPTVAVFHAPVVGLVSHAVTAAPMLLFVMQVVHCAPTVQ